MDWWQQLIAAVAFVGGTIIVYTNDVPECVAKHMRWKTAYPKAWWSAFTVAAVFVPMSVISYVSSPKSQPSQHEARKPVVDEESQHPVNQQADKMARDFERVHAAMGRKPLSEKDRKWYAEYLSVTIPAKIEIICGADECAEYERRIRKIKDGSSDIQHHFSGIEPFVTRVRYIQPQTPLAGPVADLVDNSEKPPAVETALSEVVDGPFPIVQAAHTQKELSRQNVHTIDSGPAVVIGPQGAVNGPASEPKVEAPPKTIAEPSSPPQNDFVPPRLAEFLNKQAWVQCRKCGQEHRMPYDYFAKHDHHICSRCGFTMSTVTFSAKLAKEKQQLIKQATR